MVTEYLPKVKTVKGSYFFIKRGFDIVSSFLLLIVLIPLFLFLIIADALSTHGEPFFLDKRVGYQGKSIRILKFRSMVADAEDHPEKYLNEEQMEEWKKERKVKNDPRITRFGLFLRKSSLDELPQLFNILGGSLSVVGPRAITETELSQNYTEEQKKIFLSAKPGLTGYWQVYARNDATYESGERVKLEMTYFEKRGLWLDFYLILATIPSMAKHQGE
jgi:lipopolysaccharide/colanic/teichoic acid biosynthesis glycosyltransferase